MKRKVVWQLLVPLLGLCVLFLLLTLDPAQSRRRAELLEVSVVLRESDTTAWTAARQGMEQAAADLDAELRLLTLSQRGSAQEQATLLGRELDGGADALVLVPADRSALADTVQAVSTRAPVVTLETDMSAYGATACVSVDNAALGEALATAALNGVRRGETVLLLDSVPGDTGVTERLNAAKSLLVRQGRVVRVCRPASDRQSLEDALAESLQLELPTLVIAFDAGALEQAEDTVRSLDTQPLLYGMGATNTVAAGLEQGWITAIAAQNEFAAGYLAVEAAVNAARGTAISAVEPLAFSLLRRENMYDPDSQKLLFPVTR